MLELFGFSILSVPSIAKFLRDVRNGTWLRLKRGGICIETILERGPVSRQHGFTETAVKITVVNESESVVRIKDVRLMFCGPYGTAVAPTAPLGRSHPELPVNLDSGVEENW